MYHIYQAGEVALVISQRIYHMLELAYGRLFSD